MFIPIRDAPNPRGHAFVNYLLIAVNVIVYLALTLPLSGQAVDANDPALVGYLEFLRGQIGEGVRLSDVVGNVSAYDLFVFQHGFRPAEGTLQTLMTSMFLHGGFMHLAGNMLFLWIYGDNCEQRLGRFGYLVAYLGTGIAATLMHALFDLDSNVPMVGASGAISGVLGLYFVFFPKNTVKVFVALLPIMFNVIQVPARIVLGAYLVIDNLFPVLFGGGAGGGVAHGAHIGGFLAGLGVSWLVGRRARGATPREYRRVPKASPSAEGAAGGSGNGAFAQLMAEERFEEAASLYFGQGGATAVELSAPNGLALGRWLAENRHAQAALVVYQRLLRRYSQGAVAAESHLGCGLVQLHSLEQAPSAYQHFVSAIDLDPTGPIGAKAREALESIPRR